MLTLIIFTPHLFVFPLFALLVVLNDVEQKPYSNSQQEQNLSQQQSIENFSVGQRIGTYTLNTIPGLGSIIIMDDKEGAIVQWILFGGGCGLMYKGFTKDEIGLLLFGALSIYAGSTYNAFRSLYYDKPRSIAYQKNDGFNLAVLPNRHGELMPYIFYSRAF